MLYKIKDILRIIFEVNLLGKYKKLKKKNS